MKTTIEYPNENGASIVPETAKEVNPRSAYTVQEWLALSPMERKAVMDLESRERLEADREMQSRIAERKKPRKPTPTAEATEAEEAEARLTFDGVKRAFEMAYASGDYDAPLWALSLAITASVLKKLSDPRRTADQKEATTSSQNDRKKKGSGQNPVIMALRRDLQRDKRTMVDLAEAMNNAYALEWDKNGNPRTKCVDRAEADRADALSNDTLSDAMELVDECARALLEMAEAHATVPGWLDAEYNVRRLSKRVYIKLTDSAQYRDEVTTPIQEVYREVRRAVEQSRAVQADPRNGYTYVEAYADDDNPNGADVIYYRMHKYADIGGNVCTGHYDSRGEYAHDGLYNAGLQSVMDYNTMLEKLDLTERQAKVIQLRMSGYGCQAIASYFGVTERAIYRTLERVQERCKKLGYDPENK